MNYHHAKYLKGAAKVDQLPTDSLIEVAFAGRSNAGKSSALNTLTNQKALARTSKQPGRTQLINYFLLDDGKFLVDLPGYGYAKVPTSIKKNWQKTLDLYLTTRDQLKGIILLVDSRHPLKEFDIMMIQFAKDSNINLHILLTKSDKLSSNNKKNNALNLIKKEISSYDTKNITTQLFSSLTKEGLPELKLVLNNWFEQDT
jgi:GTP-binding protein